MFPGDYRRVGPLPSWLAGLNSKPHFRHVRMPGVSLTTCFVPQRGQTIVLCAAGIESWWAERTLSIALLYASLWNFKFDWLETLRGLTIYLT